MIHYFETVYRPAAKNFTGYIDLNILKLRAVLVGSAPAAVNYRFTIRFENEELRQLWVHSNVHQVVWPHLETFLSSHQYDFLLFEVI